MTEILGELQEQVVEGATAEVVDLTEQALRGGVAASAILNEALIPAMNTVGALFESGEYYLPEMMAASQAMQASLKLLRPLLAETGLKPVAKAILGTVQGDLHDIGKNLVGTMLEGAGFEIVDLGADVPAEQFIEAIKTSDAQVVGLSALLTTTMPMMRTIIEAIEEAGLRNRVKIIIGGAPITQPYADEIGADGYAPDASSSVRMTKRLLGIGV
jgi:5-methyltetrahydrofolate--homocysteine methyltransferase